MNVSLGGGTVLVLLIPIVLWFVAFYMIVRFLRAFERATAAHERIADALTKSVAGSRIGDRGN